MGTTLTGLTPATTYDALIKVGDNGPLSATAKYVGDGLGNDSVVALSTSSVGIGTTSPTQLLHVAGNVRITGAFYDSGNAAGTSGQILSSTGTGTDWVSKSDLSLVDGSGTANYVSKWSDTDTLTNSIIYDNGTNVGIGTSSPTSMLTLNGTTPFIRIERAGVPTWQIQNNTLAIDAGFSINNVTNATTPFFINGTNDNVGIGTSSPSQPLVVFKANAGDDIGQIIQQGANGTAAFLNIVGNNDAGASFNRITSFTSGGTAHWQIGGGGAASTMVLLTGGSERMRITSTGNVGIGTNSPTEKLHIVGSSDVTVRLQRTGVRELNLSSAGITATSEFLNLTSDYGALSAITFIANSAERMRITSAGNVGIQTSTASRVLTLKNNTGSTNGISFQSSVTTSEIAAIECNQSLDTIDFEMVSNYAGNGFRFLTGAPTLVERARFTANGLTFNGDTAAANALDDYEEGTFTPILSDGTNDATMDVNNTAAYTKIGRVVYCSFTLSTSSLGSVSGNIQVNGLPFAQSISMGPSAFTSAANQLLNITSGQFVSGRILGNDTSIELWLNDDSAGMTRMQATEWSSNGYANFTGYYFV